MTRSGSLTQVCELLEPTELINWISKGFDCLLFVEFFFFFFFWKKAFLFDVVACVGFIAHFHSISLIVYNTYVSPISFYLYLHFFLPSTPYPLSCIHTNHWPSITQCNIPHPKMKTIDSRHPTQSPSVCSMFHSKLFFLFSFSCFVLNFCKTVALFAIKWNQSFNFCTTDALNRVFSSVIIESGAILLDSDGTYCANIPVSKKINVQTSLFLFFSLSFISSHFTWFYPAVSLIYLLFFFFIYSFFFFWFIWFDLAPLPW